MDVSVLVSQPTLRGRLVRLEPLGPEHFEGLWPMFAVDAGQAGDGLAEFTRAQVRSGMALARDRHDRADWTIIRLADDAVLGEVVLFELDEDCESMEFRIALVGPAVFDRGYGTEATRLVRDFALGPLACTGSRFRCSTTTPGHDTCTPAADSGWRGPAATLGG